MTFEQIWGNMGYLSAVLIAVFLVAWKMPHRKYFAIRTICCTLVLIVYKFSFKVVMDRVTLDSMAGVTVWTLDAFAVYLLSLISVGICFECNIWAMLFCATAGYCMQHMSQRVYTISIKGIHGRINPYAGALILCAITAVFYIVIFYLFIKKADYRGTMLDNKVQISVSAFAVAITIFLNSFALKAVGYGNGGVYIMLFSIVTAILVVYIEFGWLAAKKAEIEKDVIRRIADDAQGQFRLEKEIVDLMNIKAHDLKHQLSALDGKITQRELDGIRQTVAVYDSMFKTGNLALDVTLTSKGLICEKNGIIFTCLVDGIRFLYLADEEIYSLFGNIMDNAIEAVMRLEDAEKRIISLSSRIVGDRIVITEENYFQEAPVIENGLPKTTKDDNGYHGFGLKSIKHLCDKYGGDCSVDIIEDRFEIHVVLPIERT